MRLLARARLCVFLVPALLLKSELQAASPRDVWIDTDLSIGSPLREVDDAYALLLAFHSPEIHIIGISTTYGNAPLRATTDRARDLARRLGRSITISPGARSAEDLGHATAATEALATALRKNQRVTYIALGPLTNLATFLTLRPNEAKRLTRVIMVAGKTPAATLGFGPDESFRIHDANFVKDRAAIRVVLDSKIPLVLAPIETSSRLTITRDDLRELRAASPAAHYVAQKSGAWLSFWTHIPRAGGGPIFDALAVLAAVRPELLTTTPAKAEIDDQDALIVTTSRGAKGRAVSFCSGFSPGTKRFLLQRMKQEK